MKDFLEELSSFILGCFWIALTAFLMYWIFYKGTMLLIVLLYALNR